GTLAVGTVSGAGYYPIGLTNSDKGDDSRGGDCNSGHGSDSGSGGGGSDGGDSRHNMHADLRAYYVCGRRHSRPAPCRRTMTRLCLGIDVAIWALRTALLLPK